MKASALAPDLLKGKIDYHSTKTYEIENCHSCGTKFTRNSPQCRSVLFDGFVTWYCSDRCRDWFQSGNPSFSQQQQLSSKSGPDLYRGKPMHLTKMGFRVPCANCGKELDSKGLRCCSKDCEKELRLRFDDLGLKHTPSRLYTNLEALRHKAKAEPTGTYVSADVDLMKKIKRKELVH